MVRKLLPCLMLAMLCWIGALGSWHWHNLKTEAAAEQAQRQHLAQEASLRASRALLLRPVRRLDASLDAMKAADVLMLVIPAEGGLDAEGERIVDQDLECRDAFAPPIVRLQLKAHLDQEPRPRDQSLWHFKAQFAGRRQPDRLLLPNVWSDAHRILPRRVGQSPTGGGV